MKNGTIVGRGAGASLLLLCIAVLASCQTKSPEEKETKAADSAAALTQTEAAEPAEVSGIPENLDLGGETVHMWYTTGWPSYTDIAGEQSGDVLDDAVYMQNLAVQEKLNCIIDFEDPGVAQGSCADEVQKILLANDSTFDVYCMTQWSGVKLIPQGLLMNVNDAPYLSYDKPWWDIAYMREGSIGEDRIYTLVGDCTIDRVRYLSCVYYNKQMYQNYFEDPDGMYQTVLDGDWTYDTLKSISQTVYTDLNGNNKADEDDRIGARLCWNQDIMALQYCTGVPLTERDADGIPHLVADSEAMMDVVSRLYSVVFETPGIVYGSDIETTEIENAVRQFSGERSMFLFGQLQSAEYLRDMTMDYGVIPTPKLDSEQEKYHSYVFEVIRFMSLPYNCQKVEASCAVLEEMAFQGYQNVSPVYYETVLKNKYIRDNASGQMIDLVRDGMCTDIALIHINRWSDVSILLRDVTFRSRRSNSYASDYEKRKKGMEKDGEKFIATFLENT